MQQYIMFDNEDFKGVKGYLYRKGVKYRIKSQDTKYYYVMSDKICKDNLNEVKYIIDAIIDIKNEKEKVNGESKRKSFTDTISERG